jgi:hypothetical protein
VQRGRKRYLINRNRIMQRKDVMLYKHIPLFAERKEILSDISKLDSADRKRYMMKKSGLCRELRSDTS